MNKNAHMNTYTQKTHTTLKDLIYQASLQHCHVLRKITIFGKIMNIKTLPNYK